MAILFLSLAASLSPAFWLWVLPIFVMFHLLRVTQGSEEVLDPESHGGDLGRQLSGRRGHEDLDKSTESKSERSAWRDMPTDTIVAFL